MLPLDSILVIALIVAFTVVLSLRLDDWIMGLVVRYFGDQE